MPQKPEQLAWAGFFYEGNLITNKKLCFKFYFIFKIIAWTKATLSRYRQIVFLLCLSQYKKSAPQEQCEKL